MKRNIDRFLLAAACIIPFLRLGIGEIQPWDESLYIIRAEACLKFGAWLDQTKYAVGGLYSGWHPPFGVWMIALSKYISGNSTLSARLPIAIAASASIFILWLVVKRFASREAALIASVSLAAADLFVTYSHRAQMESFILFFGVASIYTLVKSIDRESWMWSAASGILLGLGLLTKLGYAMYSVPFAMLLPWATGKSRAIPFVCVMLAVALCISLPWFLMMINNHPGFIGYVRDYLQTFRNGNYAPSSLAWWYYLNRLIVALPLIVICFFTRKPNRLIIASAVWLLAVGLALQIVGTRMPHFAFLLLAPGALLIGMTWDYLKYEVRSMKYEKGNAKTFILHASYFIIMILIIGYSASEQVRLFLTERLHWNEFIIRPGGVAAFVIIIVIGIVSMKYAETKAKAAVGFSALLLAIAFAHIFSIQKKVYENGAEEVAVIANSLPSKSRIVVIHPDFPHEEYAPQLAYYTDGWTLGWQPGKRSQVCAWENVLTNYSPDSVRDIAVITGFRDRFNRAPASDTILLDSIRAKLVSNFGRMKSFRSYTVFY